MPKAATTIISTEKNTGAITVTERHPPADDLFRLLTWFSPAYPVGAFAYSHGLEAAIDQAWLKDADMLSTWLEDLLGHGSARNDAVLVAAAYLAAYSEDLAQLRGIAELGAALAPSAELRLESQQQGQSFMKITDHAWGSRGLDLLARAWPGPYVFPVVAGVAGAGSGVGLDGLIVAYLHGLTSNLISAAVRAVPLGQSDGQRVLHGLASHIIRTARECATGDLEEIGSACLFLEICSMQHETQTTRLFRS